MTESKPSAITDICGQILPLLEDRGYSKEDVFAVHLALEEAFVNAIKHGNCMDPRKKVRIDYVIGPWDVAISLTDEGSGFDPSLVPDPRDGQNIYKPEGRGLLLIRSYMDTVEFSERGNSIRMVRYRQRPYGQKVTGRDEAD